MICAPTGPGPDARAWDVAGVTAELVLRWAAPAFRRNRGGGWVPSTSPPAASPGSRCRFSRCADPRHPCTFDCHLLFHEDQRMMGQFVITGPGQRPDSGERPTPAPAASTDGQASPGRLRAARVGRYAWPRGDQCLSASSEPGRGSALGMVSAHGPVSTWLSESAATTSCMKALARRAFPSPSRLHATLAAPAPGCFVLGIQQSCRIGRHDRHERQRIHPRSAHLCPRGEGKAGRRVVGRLRARGLPVRVGSRSGEPPLG